MNTPPTSFRKLLRVWILGYTTVALVLSTLLFIKYVNNEIGERLDLAQKLIQLYSDDTVSIEFGRGNLVYVADSLKRLNQLLAGEKARVRDVKEVIVESTDASEIGLSRAESGTAIATLSAVVREHSSAERLGTLEVLVNRRTLAVGAFKGALTPALAFFLGLFVFSIFVIRTLQRRVIRPVRQLLSTRPVSQQQMDCWPLEIRDLASRLERTLKQRDLAMIGQFSSGILHDIKTSLHSLKTAVQLVDESKNNPARQGQCMQLLYSAAAHHVPKMDEVVSTTLDGNREIKVHPIDSDLTSTLQNSVSEYSEMLKKYRVKLDINTQAIDGSVPHDPIQMERVFSNILRNAIEATAENSSSGERTVSIRAAKTSDSVALIFDDSGPGLKTSPEELLNSVRSNKVHGSGLGLWVSRKIIEAHHGSLTPGKSLHLSGASFVVTLPSVSEIAQ